MTQIMSLIVHISLFEGSRGQKYSIVSGKGTINSSGNKGFKDTRINKYESNYHNIVFICTCVSFLQRF